MLFGIMRYRRKIISAAVVISLTLWAAGFLLLVFSDFGVKRFGWGSPFPSSKLEGLSSKELSTQLTELERQLELQKIARSVIFDKLRSLGIDTNILKELRARRKFITDEELSALLEQKYLVNNNPKDGATGRLKNEVLMQPHSQHKQPSQALKEEARSGPLSNFQLPILVMACNRVNVTRALDLLINHRPDPERFPIIVSQDCGDETTAKLIRGYGNEVKLIQQPDQSFPKIPPGIRKPQPGYYRIARHYHWAFDQIFYEFHFSAAVIVEDDLEIASDFYEYFSATLPLLIADKTLFCVSAWNDNGKEKNIDLSENGAMKLYRTDFFPGLGWMLTKDLWDELSIKWPNAYWDDWLREPEQRKSRQCIRPEISRTKTFGKKGVSNGQYFEQHLKYIVLNDHFVPFTQMDLTYLLDENYAASFTTEVNRARVVSLAEIRVLKQQEVVPIDQALKIRYDSYQSYRQLARILGIMDDLKAGVPRTAYKGIVTVFFRGRRIFIVPPTSWKGYTVPPPPDKKRPLSEV
ncbi:unnamed protein product [Cyprideis torosa]|uniref:Alpha-1,3-mannosyl-glycoprotein 2-beta-N-acetylglucosaminyltransferase n=1 Tax=Cyprideis torosa TaxID=163714 RepID=A0A7R8WAW4_9CRUS|nr:unnamed protein product [Cyprideis torosa]CAG0890125.1 unnamed protein product [Cyprideis torosa]